MFIILLFLAAALLAAALFVCLTGAALWKGLLIFLGVFVLMHVLYLLVLYLASLTEDRHKPLEKQNAICRGGCAGLISIFCAYCNVRPHIVGEEKLPKEQKFLLVCNHRSMFDPLVIMDRLRKYNISFISKPSNMELPFLGRIAHGAGFLAIDRENNRNALKTILQAADYLKRGICSMAVYPEGTRSRTGELLPFHPGCFKVAQRAGVPLVISAVRGTENVKKRLPFRATDVYLDILEVLPPERVKEMSTNELSDHSRALMEESLAKAAV